MKKTFSIVLPVYKNEGNLPITIPYIIDKLSLFSSYKVEIILVCDGSPDNSLELIRKYQKQYPKIIKYASFTKNCGQRAAINCGMRLAKGDVIGVISADLQDPFELFVDMLEYWENGTPLVIAYRENRMEKGISVKCSNMLHEFIRKNINSKYPSGGFDFFLVDRKIANAFVESDTFNNSMQLLLLDLTDNVKQIGYTRKQRTIGSSGWGLLKKIDQAINIIVIYSSKPFNLMAITGSFLIFLGIVICFMSLVPLLSGNLYGLLGEMFALVFFMSGIISEVGALVGVYFFKCMQNITRKSRYIISEVADETEDR